MEDHEYLIKSRQGKNRKKYSI